MNHLQTREREPARGRGAAKRFRWGVALLLALGGAGCSLDALDSNVLPKDVSDPAITQTPEGARAAYAGTLAQFRQAFGGNSGAGRSFILESGFLSDELLGSLGDRNLPEGADYANSYSALQKVRGQAGQAIGLLTHYLPDQPALAGQLYALQGYAEIFLAELFCSGIPLSTLDFDGDFTYRSGSSTEAVLTHAVALFDTALTLAGDSTRFVNLARVGQARALLGLSEYVEAAATGGGVPDDYAYEVRYSNATVAAGQSGWTNFADSTLDAWKGITVPDREGANGLNWRTSGDPRTRVSQHGTSSGVPIYHPDKYLDSHGGADPIVLASGVEARLIEAEAALRAGDAATWLTKLNHLRQTAWTTIKPPIAGALPDTTDPGTDAARVDLMFRERAFWLFLTGHRQGDLRRLIRQYGRLESDVYPVGLLPGSATSAYGSDVTVPIPPAELVNPLFTGCLSRGA